MTKINTSRLLLGALLAGIVYFICDGIIHSAILASDYEAAMRKLGINPEHEHDPMSFVFFGVFDFLKGLVAMLFYVMARTRFGAGPKTAAIAGVVAWLACEVTPAVAAMPFPFFPKTHYLTLIALELIPMILGAIAGAWAYRE